MTTLDTIIETTQFDLENTLKNLRRSAETLNDRVTRLISRIDDTLADRPTIPIGAGLHSELGQSDIDVLAARVAGLQETLRRLHWAKVQTET